MPEDQSPLEERVERLEARITALNVSVERLRARLESTPDPARSTRAAAVDPAESAPLPPLVREVAPSGSVMSDDLLSWAGRAALLPRLSALAFLLVVALGLRTVTDYGLIDRQIGSVMGMSYAALLMLGGWLLYRQSIALAPVFAACGAVLMAIIVLETHARFGSLSNVTAYGLLIITGVGMALLSRGFNSFLPVSLGTLAMCLAGIAIDYPDPFFPGLALVLGVANGLGYSAARIRRCSWLRWTVFGVTLSVMLLWSWKLRFGLTAHQGLHPGLHPDLFLPAVGLLTGFHAFMAFLGLARGGGARPSRYDLATPPLGVAAGFALAWLVAGVRGQLQPLGVAGGALAVLLAGGGLALHGLRPPRTEGAVAFMVAAALLAVLSLPAALGNRLVPLPALSLGAFGLALLARRWNSRGLRLTSSLLQIYTGLALALVLRGSGQFSVSAGSAVVAAAPAVIAFLHYRWSRSLLPAEGEVGGRTSDPGAAFVLVVALVSAFYTLRVGVYQLLRFLPVDLPHSFRAAETVLITAGAVALMLLALARRNRELRNAAILVTVIGALKVFMVDLLVTRGMPLLVSLASFGIAAALQSLALGRWSRVSARERDESSPEGD